MNFGLYPGFTPARAAAAASTGGSTTSALRVVYVPSWFPTGVIADANENSLLLMDTSSPRTETIEPGATASVSSISFAQWGASQLTIAAGSGVTLRIPSGKLAKTRAQFSRVTLLKISGAANEWLIDGDLATA